MAGGLGWGGGDARAVAVVSATALVGLGMTRKGEGTEGSFPGGKHWVGGFQA